MDQNGTRCNDYWKISVHCGGSIGIYKVSTHLLDGSLDSIGRKPDLEQVGHFLRFMTLMHISSSPSFASPAGKALIAEIALAAYSCARARVCSNPSVCPTISRA